MLINQELAVKGTKYQHRMIGMATNDNMMVKKFPKAMVS
jgi:hypothetical protein